MDNRTRRDKEMAYISDEEIYKEQAQTRKLIWDYNNTDPSDFKLLQDKIKKIINCKGDAFVNPPFRCDYGFRINVGENFYANYNLTVLDVGLVTIGDNCMFGPNVSLYAAGHPVFPDTRNSLYEYGRAITIGDNCWLGGDVVVLPGVTIGSNCVIGAGSVVTKDIPSWSIACGNPCKVIRKITEKDRHELYKGTPIDSEAYAEIERILAKTSKK